MRYFAYIIESTVSRRWYIGYSSDLDSRLNYHNKGFNRSTRGREPWRYIFQREFTSMSDALDFEKYLKKARRKKFIMKKFAEHFLKNMDGVHPEESRYLNHSDSSV